MKWIQTTQRRKFTGLQYGYVEINNFNITPLNISEQLKKEDEIFEYALRNLATPPIKGEITKGKIKWRGIKIIYQKEELKTIKWLAQRGKQISQKIILEVYCIL